MKLMNSVGPGCPNKTADVALVQWALSVIEVKQQAVTEGNPNQSRRTTLWQVRDINGKYSPELGSAIAAFEKQNGLAETRKVSPHNKTQKSIRSQAARVHHLVSTPAGLMSRSKFAEQKRQGLAARKIALINLPLLRGEANALARVIEAAANSGVGITVPSIEIDGANGRFLAHFDLKNENYALFFEKPAMDHLKTLLAQLAGAHWKWNEGGYAGFVSANKYDFLNPKHYRSGNEFLRQVGVSRSDYRKDKNVATILNAFTRILSDAAYKDPEARQKLANMLYPIRPDAARRLRGLFANGRTITDINELFPLYKIGATLSLPPFKLLGEISFSANLILNPNNRKEYLLLELNAGVVLDAKSLVENAKKIKKMLQSAPKTKWSFADQLEPISQSISDFRAGSVDFDGSFEAKIVARPYVLILRIEPKGWSASPPKIFDVPVDDLDDIRTAANSSAATVSPTGPQLPKKIDILDWDLGTVRLQIRTLESEKETSNIQLEAGAKLKFFFEFDADFWDPVLYHSIPDVVDLGLEAGN